jgi:gluconokinase
LIIVVMGVAGAGKSTLGRMLARALDWTFVEGDAYHPSANRDKMARGEALDDSDRAPWLERLHRRIAEIDEQGESAVVACSALKSSYRTALAENIPDVRFVFLRGSADTIAQRIRRRRGHFMPPDLLGSQLAELEPPQDAITVSVETTTQEQVDLVLRTTVGDLSR